MSNKPRSRSAQTVMELQAELASLREQVRYWSVRADEAETLTREQEDELARLCEAMAQLGEERNQFLAQGNDAMREVARLREKLEAELTHCRQAQAESARLRGDYEQADKAYRTQALLASKYEAENARLRGTIDRQVKAERERDRLREEAEAYQREIAGWIADLKASDTEVARLREVCTFLGVDPETDLAKWQALREALRILYEQECSPGDMTDGAIVARNVLRETI